MKRLWKITGTPGSNGLSSSPTVLGFGDDEVVLVGYKLDAETRRRLDFPDSEDAIVMPKELYMRGAGKLADGG